MEAIDGDTFTPKKKKALLIYNLGTEGRNILKSLPLEIVSTHVSGGDDGDSMLIDDYAFIIRTPDKRFNPKKNVVLERHKFLQRAQIPEESIDDFVASLRTLASTCNYREFKDEIIRDQLIERTSNKKGQEKLLSTKDPDLENALRLARSIEHSQFCMQEMNETTKFEEVKQLNAKHSAKPAKGTNSSSTRNPEMVFSKAKFDKSELVCFRCSSKSHLGNTKFCFALNQTCFKCRRKGQLA